MRPRTLVTQSDYGGFLHRIQEGEIPAELREIILADAYAADPQSVASFCGASHATREICQNTYLPQTAGRCPPGITVDDAATIYLATDRSSPEFLCVATDMRDYAFAVIMWSLQHGGVMAPSALSAPPSVASFPFQEMITLLKGTWFENAFAEGGGYFVVEGDASGESSSSFDGVDLVGHHFPGIRRNVPTQVLFVDLEETRSLIEITMENEDYYLFQVVTNTTKQTPSLHGILLGEVSVTDILSLVPELFRTDFYIAAMAKPTPESLMNWLQHGGGRIALGSPEYTEAFALWWDRQLQAIIPRELSNSFWDLFEGDMSLGFNLVEVPWVSLQPVEIWGAFRPRV